MIIYDDDDGMIINIFKDIIILYIQYIYIITRSLITSFASYGCDETGISPTLNNEH